MKKAPTPCGFGDPGRATPEGSGEAALHVGLAGVTLGADRLAVAGLELGHLAFLLRLGGGNLGLALLFGNRAFVLLLIALRLHGVHLGGAAGAELVESGAREVLVRLRLREAVGLHVAVVDDQVLAGGGSGGAHLAEFGASLGPLAVHLGLGFSGAFHATLILDGLAGLHECSLLGIACAATGQKAERGERDDQGHELLDDVHVDSPSLKLSAQANDRPLIS